MPNKKKKKVTRRGSALTTPGARKKAQERARKKKKNNKVDLSTVGGFTFHPDSGGFTFHPDKDGNLPSPDTIKEFIRGLHTYRPKEGPPKYSLPGWRESILPPKSSRQREPLDYRDMPSAYRDK